MDDNECIRFSDNVKNLGFWFDAQLKLDKQINRTVSHCHKLVKDIWKVRNVLSKHDTEKLVHSLISTKLDSCNSLYYNTSKKNYTKLQKAQNAAARLVCKVGRQVSISKTIESLHWLPVEDRILFKLIMITHKCIWGKCSNNLIELLSYKSFSRSDQDLLLSTPSFRGKYGKRSFSYIAPRLWNSLAPAMRAEDNTDGFKKQLKTLLFNDADTIRRKALCYQ